MTLSVDVKKSRSSHGKEVRLVDDSEFLCGIRSFRPDWLQILLNKKLFVLFFAVMEIGQSMFLSYFRSVITTLEKQFSVGTQTIAVVMVGGDISQILCGLVLAYYGSQGNRPRWIASGMLIVSVGCLMSASPIVFDVGHVALISSQTDAEVSSGLCATLQSPRYWSNISSSIVNLNGSSSVGFCDPSVSSTSVAALSFIFWGRFLAGAGMNMIVTLTLPYLDDSTTKSASALYIAIITGLRVMGPSLGSMLGGFCLSFYITLSPDPGITASDPRWLGAWWLGYIVLAAIFTLGASVIVWFPRSPRRYGKRAKRDVSALDISNNNNTSNVIPTRKKVDMKGLPSTLGRLLTNKILMVNAAARCLTLFGQYGFDTFQPKYLESHFRQTASGASFLALSGNAMRIVGTVAVGVIFRFWKPRAVFINAWNIILDVLFVISLIVLMSLKCPTLDIVGHVNPLQANVVLPQPAVCSANCSCVSPTYNPVCVDGTSYFSPCHAGCTAYQKSSAKQRRAFYNCSCAAQHGPTDVVLLNNESSTVLAAVRYDLTSNSSKSSWHDFQDVAIPGLCSYFCSSFTLYLIIVGIQKTLMATKKVCRTLVVLRCIGEQDRSVALALTSIMECAFAYIPCPILYGILLDASCVMWGSNCGKQSHCWLYDADYLRYVMHGLTAFFMIGATVTDCIMLYLGRSLSFFDDDDKDIAEHNEGSLAANLKIVSDNTQVTVVDGKDDSQHAKFGTSNKGIETVDWSRL